MGYGLSVIIVDDFELSRVGLRFMLSKIPNIKTISEATNSKELFVLIKKVDPDIIFMDVNLGEESGIEITKQVVAKLKYTQVIAITSSKEIQHFTKMVEAGAMGFLLKNFNQEELDKAVQEVILGNAYFSKEFLTVAQKLIPRKAGITKIKLSDRENQVLKYICLGNSNQEIAEELNLSSHTIDSQRKKLLHKIGARNTASMIMISIRDGLIDLN